MATPIDPRDRLPPFLRRYCPDQQQCWRFAAKCRSILYDSTTRIGKAVARNWTALDRAGRIFVVSLMLCCALLAVAGWSRKPGDDTRGVGGKNRTGFEWKPDYTERDKEFARDKDFDERPATHKPSSPSTPAPQPLPAETDETISAAYVIQQRFVTREIPNSPYVWGPDISVYDVWKEAGCPSPGPGKWLFSPQAETIIARSGNLFRVRGWVTFKAYRPDNKPNGNHDATLPYVCRMILDPELGTWKLSGHIEKID